MLPISSVTQLLGKRQCGTRHCRCGLADFHLDSLPTFIPMVQVTLSKVTLDGYEPKYPFSYSESFMDLVGNLIFCNIGCIGGLKVSMVQ